MLKFQIGDMVVATKFPEGDARRGPWRIANRQYFQAATEENRTYKVSRPGRNGTESRHFRESDLAAIPEAKVV